MAEDTARFTVPYAQVLNSLGLTRHAARLEKQGCVTFYKFPGGKVTKRFHAWDPMLRTTRRYADALARKQYARFEDLYDFVSGTFCTFQFTLPWTDDLKGEVESKFVDYVREFLPRHFSLVMDKVVTDKGCVVIYALSTIGEYDKHTFQMAEEDFSRAFPNALFVHRSHRKTDFLHELRKLCAARLPQDDLERARLELLLEGRYQLVVHSKELSKICPAKRAVDKSGELPGPPNYIPPRPIDSETGLLATHYTYQKHPTTKFEDLDYTDWIPYPDFYEVDCTTLEQQAEMLREMADAA
jgi:hypothetical protein